VGVVDRSSSHSPNIIYESRYNGLVKKSCMSNNPQSDLITAAKSNAQSAEANRAGDRYSTNSASMIIESNGRLEAELATLNETTKENTEASGQYNQRLLILTRWLLALTVALVILTVIVVIKA
jgi:hypothetical protein